MIVIVKDKNPGDLGNLLSLPVVLPSTGRPNI